MNKITPANLRILPFIHTFERVINSGLFYECNNQIMKKILLILSLIALFCANPSGAQNTIQSAGSSHMSSGIELYKNKMYQSALNEFDKVLAQCGEKNSANAQAEKAAGYKVLCQILLKLIYT